MIPSTAVIVWQLRGFVEDVQCFFAERPDQGFTLVVERAGELLVQERYLDRRAMMARASALRRSLVAVGFIPISAGAHEPANALEPLLVHFVREGRAAESNRAVS